MSDVLKQKSSSYETQNVKQKKAKLILKRTIHSLLPPKSKIELIFFFSYVVSLIVSKGDRVEKSFISMSSGFLFTVVVIAKEKKTIILAVAVVVIVIVAIVVVIVVVAILIGGCISNSCYNNVQ